MKKIFFGIICFLFVGSFFLSGCTSDSKEIDSIESNISQGNISLKCTTNEDCDDGNEETLDRCFEGECMYAIAPIAPSPV